MTSAIMRGGALGLILFGATALLGCSSGSQIVLPCCYIGPYSEARLGDLSITVDGGRQLAFTDVFEGFTPDEGFILRPLPFSREEIARVVYPIAAEVLPVYDVNGDGLIDEPELVALYVREGAMGLGHQVTGVGGAPEPVALATAPADISALLDHLDSHRGALTDRARRLFEEIERLGFDQDTKGSEGADAEGPSFTI